MKVTGSCLCKAVSFSFEMDKKHFGVCHCDMCRKWNGGPAFAAYASGDIEFKGEDKVKLFTSSEWAERGFCSECGSHLFYRLKDNSFCNFNLGTIDGHEDFEFTSQVYVDNKPGNYSFKNETVMMTEKEVLEAFGKS